MKKFILLVSILLASCSTPATPTFIPITYAPSPTVTFVAPTPNSDSPYLPNPNTQPGWNNPAVTQNTIQSTICVSGYSSSIRPPVSYTEPIKIQQIKDYGYADTNLADYEEDHIIALEDGGDPRDIRNLWPQPRNGVYNAGMKDTLENTIHTLICSGQISLDEGRQAIATDWVAAYKKYVNQGLLIPNSIPTEP